MRRGVRRPICCLITYKACGSYVRPNDFRWSVAIVVRPLHLTRTVAATAQTHSHRGPTSSRLAGKARAHTIPTRYVRVYGNYGPDSFNLLFSTMVEKKTFKSIGTPFHALRSHPAPSSTHRWRVSHHTLLPMGHGLPWNDLDDLDLPHWTTVAAAAAAC